MSATRPWPWATGTRRQFPESLVDDYLAGWSTPALAHREKASPMTIRAFLQVRGVELRLGSPKRSSAPVRQRKIDPHEAISMLARGMRPREIAEHYGVAEDVVRQVLTDGGVEFRGGA